MSPVSSVHWFRKGLRIHDNPALLSAVEQGESGYHQLRPVYILDPNIKKTRRIGPNRWRFLQQSLEDLDKNLRKIGTRLYVLRGDPEEVFGKLFKKWNVKKLTYEVDIEPYGRSRDASVTKLAEEAGVEVVEKVSHTIYNTEAVIAKNLGKAPLTMQKWISTAESLAAPPRAVAAPSCIPKEAQAPLDEGKYLLPSLEELGVEKGELGPCLYPGGETEALRRMEEHLARKEYIRKFEKPNTAPNSLEPSTTVLSPYFRFGCLSPRLFYYRIKEIVTGHPHSKPPVSLIGQMYWREFYYTVASATPNFDKMVDNPVCIQVPWDKNPEYLDAWAQSLGYFRPGQFRLNASSGSDINFSFTVKGLDYQGQNICILVNHLHGNLHFYFLYDPYDDRKWTLGRTGYPFIDAIMRQLRQEGWVHHLARHAVACFLTRGDMWQSWEDGQKVFEELLLDADWSLNAGNWMWLSASAFFSQFHRVYSPVVFGKKTDKLGDYIRKYVPELKKYPPEYIYEPWEAPLSVQKQAGCVVGTDYPKRVIKHEDVYKKNIGRMSAAYKHTKEMRGSPEKNPTKRASPAEDSPSKKKLKTKSKSIKDFMKK